MTSKKISITTIFLVLVFLEQSMSLPAGRVPQTVPPKKQQIRKNKFDNSTTNVNIVLQKANLTMYNEFVVDRINTVQDYINETKYPTGKANFTKKKNYKNCFNRELKTLRKDLLTYRQVFKQMETVPFGSRNRTILLRRVHYDINQVLSEIGGRKNKVPVLKKLNLGTNGTEMFVRDANIFTAYRRFLKNWLENIRHAKNQMCISIAKKGQNKQQKGKKNINADNKRKNPPKH